MCYLCTQLNFILHIGHQDVSILRQVASLRLSKFGQLQILRCGAHGKKLKVCHQLNLTQGRRGGGRRLATQELLLQIEYETIHVKAHMANETTLG